MESKKQEKKRTWNRVKDGENKQAVAREDSAGEGMSETGGGEGEIQTSSDKINK